MSTAAMMLGDGGRLPFLGHFRVRVEGSSARLLAAGRVGVGADMLVSFQAARHVERLLGFAADGPWFRTDRHGLIRRAWQLLSEADGQRLGPRGGSDLSVVMVATDARGIGVAGAGLGSVWGRFAGGVRPVATGRHPLLGVPGIPDNVPGVLTLDETPDAVVGVPWHIADRALPADGLERACGVLP